MEDSTIQLMTRVTMPPRLPRVHQQMKLLMMGSCFATEMGTRLQKAKFPCLLNPFGVVYNPLSMAEALHQLMEGRRYGPDDLYPHQGLWHSSMHHGDFSAPSLPACLERINSRMEQGEAWVREADVLVLTWGTAYVYSEKETGRVVNNCHKLPESCFSRRRLTVEEIVDTWRQLVEALLPRRPQRQLLLTVSPIRHLRDGLHDNQLSKATLLLAADELVRSFPESVSYFPAYELLTDELRDYRFYADDLTHPSSLAVDYVWRAFVKNCFTREAVQIMETAGEIGKALQHRPLHPEAGRYKSFLEQTMLKIERLNRKYPYLDLQNERELCHTLLNVSQN